MTLATRDAIQLLRQSEHMQPEWYLRNYPDVAALGMDPAKHYLLYGAMLGRNPGERFDTNYYLKAHPQAARDGMNPLLHYLLHGRAERLSCRDKVRDPMRQAVLFVDGIRIKLTNQGFSQRPLAELQALVEDDPDPIVRALAAWQLALWSMREGTEDAWRAALAHLAVARLGAPDHAFRCKLVTAELLCHHSLTQGTEAAALYERAALAGEMTLDAMLAWANHHPTPATRVLWINEVLRAHGISPVSLRGDAGLPPYDRLQPAEPLPAVTGGPKVTVLIAAYEAPATIATALRSLQEQTWQDLEIIVIDDHSPTDNTAAVVRRFADRDPRIRLLRMAANGGAYVARNHGLDHVTGTYVTVHDADDWSHPAKIETQVRYMEKCPAVMGCTTNQARATDDLAFVRLSGSGALTFENVSSFMWRRAPVREALGYWDTVRVSADNELIRRVAKTFGAGAVARIASGPLSFQRHSPSSIMTDDVLGMNGFLYGARREYFHAQRHFHASGASLRYDNDPARRPFPVPMVIQPERKRLTADRHLDIVLAGDFRHLDERLGAVIQQVRNLRAGGQRVGLVELYEYDSPAGQTNSMHPALRAEVDGEAVQILVYGEAAGCDALEVVTPGCSLADNRYAPDIMVVQPRGAAKATA